MAEKLLFLSLGLADKSLLLAERLTKGGRMISMTLLLLINYSSFVLTNIYLYIAKNMIAFSLGPIDVYRYWIFYFIAFLAGYAFLNRIAKKRMFWEKFPRMQEFLEKYIDDLMICIFLGVLLGGRVWHVIIYDFSYYLKHPMEIFSVRQWGMSFIGGIFGVTIALSRLARKRRLTGKEILLLGDMVFAILPLGIMLGRIGNYLNQELYGVVVSDRLPRLWYPIFSILNDLHIFHVYPQIDTMLRVNTNFLASFFEGLVLLIITMNIIHRRIKTKTPQPGQILGIFLIRYSTVRFLLEYLRADSQLEFHGRFSTSQRFFLWFFVIGMMIFVFRKRIK